MTGPLILVGKDGHSLFRVPIRPGPVLADGTVLELSEWWCAPSEGDARRAAGAAAPTLRCETQFDHINVRDGRCVRPEEYAT